MIVFSLMLLLLYVVYKMSGVNSVSFIDILIGRNKTNIDMNGGLESFEACENCGHVKYPSDLEKADGHCVECRDGMND